MFTSKMSLSFLLFITHRSDLTPDEFEIHWGTKHVELLESSAGEKFPISHTRTYISRICNYSFQAIGIGTMTTARSSTMLTLTEANSCLCIG
jgi:hypothetical protein